MDMKDIADCPYRTILSTGWNSFLQSERSVNLLMQSTNLTWY